MHYPTWMLSQMSEPDDAPDGLDEEQFAVALEDLAAAQREIEALLTACEAISARIRARLGVGVMATLTLPQEDHRLLSQALCKSIRLTARTGLNAYTVSSASGGADHRLIVNPSGRIACDCPAGTHGRACTHAVYLRTFLAWQRQQEAGQSTTPR